MVMPERLQRLPQTERGYPALFFAAVIDGKVNIRSVSAAKFHRCVKEGLCWLCGEKLDGLLTFVITKEAAKTGIWVEPPSHLECAEYAMEVCPFITNPGRHYASGTPQPDEYVLYTTTSYGCGPLRNSYPIAYITLGPRA
jgi:hypothetical protein